MFSLFRDIYRNNPKKFRAVLILDLLSSLTAGVGIVMLIPMISIMDISEKSTLIPAYIGDFLFGIPKLAQICIMLAIYVVLVSLKAVISRTLSIRNAELVQDYTASLRKNLYKAVAETKWEKFISYKRSELLDLLVSQAAKISYSATLLIRLISICISAAISLCIAFIMSVPLTIVVMLFGGVFLLAFRPIMRRSKEYGSELRKSSSAFLDEITNQMNGIKEIRSYGIEKEQCSAFKNVTDDYSRKNVTYARLSAMPQMLLLIGAAVMIAGLFFLATQVFSVELEAMAVLIFVFARLWPNLSLIQNYTQSVISMEAVSEHFGKVIAELSAASDNSENKSVAEITFKDKIAFDNVSFKYENTTEGVLNQIRFEMNYGEITALAGRSGAGKSTLVDLTLGFLHPSEGTISIDDKPLDSGNSISWRNSISYIPQDPILLNDTVRENLIRFHPDSTEEDLISALKKALAWDFVEKLPDKLDTLIGERGIRLSGGERQRIILARALLGKPKLLVLDEATSALDYESEKTIADSIRSLRGAITVIIVAHRLSSIQIADKVIVIENGKITESGTYHALAANANGYLGKMIQLEE